MGRGLDPRIVGDVLAANRLPVSTGHLLAACDALRAIGLITYEDDWQYVGIEDPGDRAPEQAKPRPLFARAALSTGEDAE